MYQRTVHELQDELNSFERRLLAPTSSFYKRKIYDLEAICSADLNKVRSRFVRSLQAFENTIDSIEELHPRRIKSPVCPCATANPSMENNTDGFRHEWATPRRPRYDRSLPRSKYVDTRTTCALILKDVRYIHREVVSLSIKASHTAMVKRLFESQLKG